MPSKTHVDRIFDLITLHDQMIPVDDRPFGRMPFAVFAGNFKVADGFFVVGGQPAGCVLLEMNRQAVLAFSLINLREDGA